jgi:pyridinium-3,5-biscarboxylic acid mononucleotide sulfurtransferase
MKKMTRSNLDGKFSSLKQFIAEKGKDGVVIAFSGGVDSATLASVCREVLGEKAVAVIAKSPTYPSAELAEAKDVAKEIGIKIFVIETQEMLNKDFSNNPENRCYYCKKELLTQLLKLASAMGFKAIFEGTNYSDLTEHRPGYRAVEELPNVYSPWVENKFTKDEIRELAKKRKLSIQNKPSLACLASRIPYNQIITTEKLKRIEKAEQTIKEIIKVSQLRVRDHDGLARIEVGKEEREHLCSIEIFDKINNELKQLGFKYITIDLEGYKTGSMLKTLEKSK